MEEIDKRLLGLIMSWRRLLDLIMSVRTKYKALRSYYEKALGHDYEWNKEIKGFMIRLRAREGSLI